MQNPNLIVQVVQGHEKPERRAFTNRDTGVERVSYEQKAYMHNGGAFPQEIKLSHDDLSLTLPVGKYTLDLSSFQSNKYGKLELSPFNTQFVPFDSK
jgi:hypothetical protein